MSVINPRWAGFVFWCSILVYAGLWFWLGTRWEKGRTAQRTVIALEQHIESARAATRDLHAMALSLQADHIASIERLNAIAIDWELSREQQHTQFTRQRAALAALLVSRPDLDGHAGVNILRHWQASNTGDNDTDNSGDAPAADPAGVIESLPGAAGSGRRPLGESDCESRCGDGAISPVPVETPLSHPGGADVGAGGDTGVLRGAAANAIPVAGGVR